MSGDWGTLHRREAGSVGQLLFPGPGNQKTAVHLWKERNNRSHISVLIVTKSIDDFLSGIHY